MRRVDVRETVVRAHREQFVDHGLLHRAKLLVRVARDGEMTHDICETRVSTRVSDLNKKCKLQARRGLTMLVHAVRKRAHRKRAANESGHP